MHGSLCCHNVSVLLQTWIAILTVGLNITGCLATEQHVRTCMYFRAGHRKSSEDLQDLGTKNSAIVYSSSVIEYILDVLVFASGM